MNFVSISRTLLVVFLEGVDVDAIFWRSEDRSNRFWDLVFTYQFICDPFWVHFLICFIFVHPLWGSFLNTYWNDFNTIVKSMLSNCWIMCEVCSTYFWIHVGSYFEFYFALILDRLQNSDWNIRNSKSMVSLLLEYSFRNCEHVKSFIIFSVALESFSDDLAIIVRYLLASILVSNLASIL